MYMDYISGYRSGGCSPLVGPIREAESQIIFSLNIFKLCAKVDLTQNKSAFFFFFNMVLNKVKCSVELINVNVSNHWIM